MPYPLDTPRRRTRSPGSSVGIWIIAFIALIAVFAIAFPACSSYYSKKNVTAVVQSKERVCDGGDGGCKYLIFTDRGTYKIVDSIAAGRFNSSDVYGRIKVCDRYSLTYYGWRFGLTSSYPNVVKAESMGPADGCRP